MIDKICDFLTNKIKEQNPDIDDEKAEVIHYGVELIVGEIPKIFIMIAIAFLLGIGWYTILAFFIILPYRNFSGGFHLKTHIGCVVCTTSIYCGTVLLAKYLPLIGNIKYVSIAIVWIFGMMMVKKYAPADTENVPILTKKERTQKRILSYITLTITLAVSIVINNNLIASIIIYGMLIQTISITRIAYKLTKNEYGHEVYNNKSIQSV